MSGVQTLTVSADEDGLRLDRWFRRRFPELPQGRLQKLLRTGQVRLDGGRAKADTRVTSGQNVDPALEHAEKVFECEAGKNRASLFRRTSGPKPHEQTAFRELVTDLASQ